MKTVVELRARIEHLHALTRLTSDAQALRALHDLIAELEQQLQELDETSDES